MSLRNGECCWMKRKWLRENILYLLHISANKEPGPFCGNNVTHKQSPYCLFFLNRHLMFICLLVLLFELMTIHPGVTSIPAWVCIENVFMLKPVWPQYPACLAECTTVHKAGSSKRHIHTSTHTSTDTTHHSYTLHTLAFLYPCFCQSRAQRKRKFIWHHSSVFFPLCIKCNLTFRMDYQEGCKSLQSIPLRYKYNTEGLSHNNFPFRLVTSPIKKKEPSILSLDQVWSKTLLFA